MPDGETLTLNVMTNMPLENIIAHGSSQRRAAIKMEADKEEEEKWDNELNERSTYKTQVDLHVLELKL